MKIIVLVKQVPDTSEERTLDTESGFLERDPQGNVLDEISERALEVALRHKDSHKGTEVVALTMGPSDALKALRKALSMGADSGVHVADDALAGADAMWTSRVLAAAASAEGFDLVITGNESTDGKCGVVPAMLAEHLRLPLVGSLDSPGISAESVSGRRECGTGTMTVRAGLPAVMSVTERSAEARFPTFKGILTAKKKSVKNVALAELGLSGATVSTAGRSVILSVARVEGRSGGRKIVDHNGSAATELMEFLADRQLL